MKTTIITILIFISINIFAQDKQGNTANAEVFADAPFRMKKYNQQGELTPIPIHIMVHDANGLGANVELMSIDISLKNASDTTFSDIITFDNYSPIIFDTLIKHRSNSAIMPNTQNFNDSYYEASSHHTIKFTRTHNYLDGEDYVSIERKFWYFTIMLPADVIAGYDDIIDIHVHFNIDWSVDDDTYLRIFRYTDDIPKLENWYRGDTHYHTIFTQNIAETGESLAATKMAGKYVGFDWQFTTDHSCDFDNYGSSIQANWNALGQQIYNLNQEDSSYIMIRGLEVSLNNSNTEIVHALAYPSINNPFSNPYIGDGGGDSHGTDVYIDDMLDTLNYYGGFCYAAHPFAEGDKLPDLIQGNVWNISDSAFIDNNMPAPSQGKIICNNLSASSDVFSTEPNKLFKDGLRGFQIWNLYNTIAIQNSRDNYNNPWNAMHENDVDYMQELNPDDLTGMMYRFNQNFDVIKYMWGKALRYKNQFPEIQNWKTFISAGSDAHGSFNFSNTNMYYAVYGSIENNALGKLSTLVYCPNGMGENGKNILKAMYYGHTILSDGPIINIGIGQERNNTIIIGQDTILSEVQMANNNLNINMLTSSEFGELYDAKLIIGTENGEITLPLPNENELSYNLLDVLNGIFLSDIPDKYFYVRAELTTKKDYNELAAFYNKQTEYFHSFTNPIWIKKSTTTAVNDIADNFKLNIIYSNNKYYLNYKLNNNSKTDIRLYNSTGKLMTILKNCNETQGEYNLDINLDNYPKGIYFVKFKSDKYTKTKKIIKW